jgi:hypothetical protein
VNVTVMVPRALRTVFEGRVKVNLGLPPTADVGDLLEALFKLYPKVKQHLASDNVATKGQHLSLYSSEVGAKDISWRARLREGQTLYLSVPQSRRLAS